MSNALQTRYGRPWTVASRGKVTHAHHVHHVKLLSGQQLPNSSAFCLCFLLIESVEMGNEAVHLNGIVVLISRSKYYHSPSILKPPGLHPHAAKCLGPLGSSYSRSTYSQMIQQPCRFQGLHSFYWRKLLPLAALRAFVD